MEYWCINDNFKPKWVQELIDRKLLIHKGSTGITDCYEFYRTTMSTSPVYLYDGDGLCYCNNKIGVIFNLYINFERLKAAVPMVKYYCDICEKEIFFKDDFYNLKFTKDYESKNYDICEDCYNKILEIIKSKGKTYYIGQ